MKRTLHCRHYGRYVDDFYVVSAYLKPHRRYVSNTTLHRMRSKLPALEAEENPERLRARLNSLLGILGHYCSMNIQRRLFLPLVSPYRAGRFIQTRRGLLFRLYTSNSGLSLNTKRGR